MSGGGGERRSSDRSYGRLPPRAYRGVPVCQTMPRTAPNAGGIQILLRPEPDADKAARLTMMNRI